MLKRLKNSNSTNLMILFLSFSNIIGNALTIISGFLVAKWLLPDQLGLFNGFSVITSYIILAQLGIPSGLSRELPLYIGKGDPEKARNYAAVTQYWMLLLGGISMIIAAIVAIFFALKQEYAYAAGTMVIGITALQTFYVTRYLDVLYRTNKDFNNLSKIKLITSFASFFSIWFVWQYGFYGLCIRAVVLAVVDFYFTWRWKPMDVKPAWDKNLFATLRRVGLPMYSIANIYGLWPMVQRTLILWLGGTKFLGLFALSIIIENSMNTITTSISSVIYPTMVTQWGKGATTGELLRLTYKPVAIAFSIFLVAVPLGWLLLPWIVKSFLHNYTDGTKAAQWMLLVGLIKIFTVSTDIYNVIGRQRDRLFSYICGILSWALTVFVIYIISGFSLEIFPQAMLVAFVIMILINWYHVSRYKGLKMAI